MYVERYNLIFNNFYRLVTCGLGFLYGAADKLFHMSRCIMFCHAKKHSTLVNRSFVYILGVVKMLTCPFLNRIPVCQVRQYASELLNIADRCPVMGHIIKNAPLTTQDPQVTSGTIINVHVIVFFKA